MFLIRFSINNPLLTNLLLGFVVLAGVLSWYAMPQEMFPSIQSDIVRVETLFEGAPPEEVERQLTLPIEEAFEGLDDVDVIQSVSNEGQSSIWIKLKPGANVDEFMRDARTQLDQITDLPEEAETPELTRLVARFPVISVSLYGDVARGYLFDQAEELKKRLQEIPGAASVGVAGQREWELWVVVDPHVLAARSVSLTAVTQALRDNLKDLPGGSVKSVEGDILLRGKGNAPTPASVGAIALRNSAAGGQLRLAEVAHVERRLEEAQTLGRFNGKPSVNLTVNKTEDASTIVVAQLVRERVAELQKGMPPSIQLGLFNDLSVYVKNRLNTVKSSGLVGLVLVLLSLYLFLNFRVALITAMGIPVSFLVAVIGLHYLGYTINMVSLFAFLIALGMIVDDAIIVNENVYRHMEAGVPGRQAALIGAREVFWPVIASTATTIAAFLPMFAISGTMGTFIAVIPVVVTAALLGSLAEAFGVLPSHAAELLKVRKRAVRKTRVDWSAWLRRYTRLLRWSVNHRYLVTALVFGLLAVTLTYQSTRLSFNLFSRVDIGQFFMNIEAPNTYSLEDSSRLAERIEQAIFDELEDHELASLLTNVGFLFVDFSRARFGSRYIQVVVDLEKMRPEGFIERFVSPLVSLSFRAEGQRERSTEAVINALRTRLEALPGVRRLSVLRPQGGPAGADIEVGVAGPDVEVLRSEAQRLTDFLRGLEGVHDVQHDMEPGKLEYQYTLNERGRELGLTQRQLSDAVRTGFVGLEVTHVSSAEDRLPVRLIYTEEVRRSSALERLPITLADGKTVYLGEVAEIRRDRALNAIRHRDLDRLAVVTAEVDTRITTPLEVSSLINDKFANFSQERPGYRLLALGEKKEADESFADMRRALIISLAIIFLILAALFKSMLDPLVVMFAIPFGFIGVVIGHVIFDYNLQFLSMVGFLALAGIVVNDSLILIDFAKRMRHEGMHRLDAMVEAGRVRVRPILLTSITTFLGVSPLIFFATGQTAFLSPMAVSLGFGLLFATGLILIALPCFYLIADDVRSRVCDAVRRLLGKPALQRDAAAPYCRLNDEVDGDYEQQPPRSTS